MMHATGCGDVDCQGCVRAGETPGVTSPTDVRAAVAEAAGQIVLRGERCPHCGVLMHPLVTPKE